MVPESNSCDTFKTGVPEPLSERKLEEIFQQLEQELAGTLYHLLGNQEDVKDALQEGFVRCWKNREKLSEIKKLRAWIFSVIYHIGIDMTKASWRKRRQTLPPEELLEQPTKTPLEQCSEKEELERLRTAIQQLDQPDKAIFLLRQNGSLTYEQIAQIVGLPTGTVKTKMRKVLTKLQNKFKYQSSPIVTETSGEKKRIDHDR